MTGIESEMASMKAEIKKKENGRIAYSHELLFLKTTEEQQGKKRKREEEKNTETARTENNMKAAVLVYAMVAFGKAKKKKKKTVTVRICATPFFLSFTALKENTGYVIFFNSYYLCFCFVLFVFSVL